MTKRDRLIGQVFSLVVLWYAASLPGLAADPGTGGNVSSPSGSTGLQLLDRGSGTRFASYAAQVQARIKEALLQNNKTSTASISGVRIRIWIDKAARVTRVQLLDTTGNASLDSAITEEALTGLQMKQPPPSDMPMPIVLRVTEHPSGFGSYVAQVQSTVEQTLLQNNKTNTALIVGVLVRIWVDSTGRVTRVQLPVSTANPLLDRAITDEVLTGLQLKEPPPSNMSMPIVVRVTTHRPS